MGTFDKLEPCPFCGAKVDLIAYFEGGVLKNYAIHCNCCGMETVLCTDTGACNIQYWVFKAWNRRDGKWKE